ncbi:MAG: porin family protein [Treponema sp.]|nr:porin family protein [Treponema sp.]
MRKSAFFIILFLACSVLFAQAYREARIFVPPVTGGGNDGDTAFFYRQLTYEVVLQYYALVRTQHISDFVLRGSIRPFTAQDAEREPEPVIVMPEPEIVMVDVPVVRAQPHPVPLRPIPAVRYTGPRREFFSWEIDDGIHFYDVRGEGNYEPEEITEYIQVPMTVHAPVPEAPAPVLIPPGRSEFVFELELLDSGSNEVIGNQYIIYQGVDGSVSDFLSIMVYNMLAGIPDIEEVVDWRDKWLFLETSALWTPRLYSGVTQSINWMNFGVRLALEFHFLDFLSIDLGMQFVQDWVLTSTSGYRDLTLEVPLTLKFVFKPSDHFVISPYGGAVFNYSLMGTTEPSMFSWLAGLQFGVRAGPGMIVIDPRFAVDFFHSVIGGSINYDRYSIQIGVGYKFGFISRGSRDY